MYAPQSFPARAHPWQRPQVSDTSVPERVDAYRRSNGRSKQNIKTPNPDPMPASTRSFPWVQDKVPDITVSMRSEKYKWWNAPPKTDEKSRAQAARSGKFELHVPSVEALKIDAPFLSPSRDGLRSFRDHPHPSSQTKAQNHATKLRDQNFKKYNGRAAQSTKSHTSQYLNHNTQGAMSGTPQPPEACIDETAYWIFFQDLQDWIGNWIGYLVLILAFLFFGMGPLIKIFKPVLSLLSRGGVASSLLFFFALFLLIR